MVSCAPMPGKDKRLVTEEEYQLALNDQVNCKVINKVGALYYGKLTREEVHACGLVAVWRALQSHKEGLGRKFTSSLFRHMSWECGREAQKVKRTKKTLRLTGKEVSVSKGALDQLNEKLDHVRQRMQLLPEEQRKLIEQKFFEHMTTEEISRAHGYTIETTRRRIGKALSALRRLCRRGLGVSFF